jgi:hypothetical protein
MTRAEQIQRRVRQALAQYYLLDERPSPGFEPHLFWHGPFLTCPEHATREERRARMDRAGEIWLRNKDLGYAGVLVASDLLGEESWMYRRPRRPGERSIVAGPVPGVLVRSGPRVGFVRYAESRGDVGGEAMARIARGGPA